jgi:hypothetical protein
MRSGWLLAVWCVVVPVQAQWEFAEPLWPAGEARVGVYPQLDGTARKHVAVDEAHVAVVWSDNRDGAYQARAAFRALDGRAGFGPVQTLSTGGEAYHPVVLSLGNGRFLFAWEQDERIWTRTGGADGLGPARQLEVLQSTQPALAGDPELGLVAACVRREDGVQRVVSASLEVDGADVRQVDEPVPVDPMAPESDQIYPTVAVTPSGVVVAWEDRRGGHTRLYYAFRGHEGAFGALRDLNDRRQGPRTQMYGAGSGVTRVALAARDDRVVAVWMDKRDYRSGYDIFASVSDDGGRMFGANEMVQDMFGAEIPQWHPGVGISPQGTPLAVWDDPRDDSPDVWMSWREGGGWSDDVQVSPAYGPGAHTRPAAAFGPDGRLHVVWTSRTDNGLSRLGYVEATAR